MQNKLWVKDEKLKQLKAIVTESGGSGSCPTEHPDKPDRPSRERDRILAQKRSASPSPLPVSYLSLHIQSLSYKTLFNVENLHATNHYCDDLKHKSCDFCTSCTQQLLLCITLLCICVHLELLTSTMLCPIPSSLSRNSAKYLPTKLEPMLGQFRTLTPPPPPPSPPLPPPLQPFPQ